MSKAKLEEHGAAIADASMWFISRVSLALPEIYRHRICTNSTAQAIAINPQYAKAFYRRGVSYLAILRPAQAVPDFKQALAIDPHNKSIRDQLNATVKLIRRIEFEKVHMPLHMKPPWGSFAPTKSPIFADSH